MADGEENAIRVAMVAACMAGGLTPAQTQKACKSLEGIMPADQYGEIQLQLQRAINSAVGIGSDDGWQ